VPLNLYDIHPDPKDLPHYDVPDLVWAKYYNQPEELKKCEDILAKDAGLAFHYAFDVLKGPFPAAETAIAKDAAWAYYYAVDVLKGPFPAGEAVIAQDACRACCYAEYVLGGPFPAGEAAIAKNASRTFQYGRFVLKLPVEEAMNWARTLT